MYSVWTLLLPLDGRYGPLVSKDEVVLRIDPVSSLGLLMPQC